MRRVNVAHVSPLQVARRIKFNEILLGIQQSHQESFQQVPAVVLDLEGNKIAQIRQNSQVTEKLVIVRLNVEVWEMVEVTCLFSLLKIKCTRDLINFVLNFWSTSPGLCLALMKESESVSHSVVTHSVCDPVDYCSPPASSVHGILQARILEWFMVSFPRGYSWPRDWTQLSCIAGIFFAAKPP